MTASATTGAFAPAHIIELLGRPGFAVLPAQAQGIADYLNLLLHWNRRISLTSITDPEQIIVRHVGESLFGARVARIESGTLLDIGSGAGFPALPIALFFPGIQEVLLEPNVKKAAFLAEASRMLQVAPRVKIQRERLEAFYPAGLRFDFITCRAVRLSSAFLEHCQRLLSLNGNLVLWIGQADAESVRRMGGWTWSEPSKIPESERRVILCGTPAATQIDVPRETFP